MGDPDVRSGWSRRRSGIRARITILVAVVACATVTSGCEARDPTLAGTPLDDLPTLVLQEELRLGSLDDPVVGFSSLGDMWVAPNGEIWVAERQADEIRVYGEDGALLRTYGRSGDGPGEFRTIYAFGLLGDTLWVSDSGLNRTTLFSLDGEVLETVTARVQISLGETTDRFAMPATLTLFPHALRPDGRIESDYIRRIYANLADSVASVPKLLFDRDGAVVDTIEVTEEQVSRTAIMVEWENGGSYIYPDPPVQDSGTSTLQLDDGSFSIHWSAIAGEGGGAMIATRIAADGDTLFDERLRYDPRPVTARHLDSLAAASARAPGLTRSDSLQLIRAARDALRRPDHHPPVRPPTSVGGGLIWMRLDPDLPAVNRWLVYRDATRDLAVVELPVAASFLRSSDGETVWIMERDEFRVPWLVRYRISLSGRAAEDAG